VRISIHQSHYLPWLRYFDKIARSDVFVLLDDIQFNRNGWQNRNKVKGPGGSVLLTVPVLQHFQQSLAEVACNPSVAWQRKHWRTIEQLYGKAPFFSRYAPGLQAFYQKSYSRLVDVNEDMLRWFLAELGIKTRLIVSHDLAVGEIATARLVAMCQQLGAAEYLTGAYALGAYLDPQAFHQAGIGLVMQEWHSPEYVQQFAGAGYLPDLAIVDLLLNHGPGALNILLAGGEVRQESAIHA
jgi:hypothetical protein